MYHIQQTSTKYVNGSEDNKLPKTQETEQTGCEEEFNYKNRVLHQLTTKIKDKNKKFYTKTNQQAKKAVQKQISNEERRRRYQGN